MKVTRIYAAWLAIISLCLGCTEQNNFTSLPDSNEKNVIRDIPLSVMAMEDPNATTRGIADKSPAEQAIRSVWVFQFDGTGPDAKLVNYGKMYDASSSAWNGRVSAKFKPAINTTQAILVIANVTTLPSGIAVGTTTKSAMLNMVVSWAPCKDVPSGGLPMRGYTEFDPMTVSTVPSVTLKPMVAKVIVTYNLSVTGLGNYLSGAFNLKVRQSTNGALLTEWPAGNASYNTNVQIQMVELQLATINVSNSYTGVCYLPENLAGRKTITPAFTEKSRSLAKAPARSTYLELSGKTKDNKNIKFVYFLGAQGNLNDFNVVRNHVYNVKIDIKGIFRDDERITIG